MIAEITTPGCYVKRVHKELLDIAGSVAPPENNLVNLCTRFAKMYTLL